MNTFHFLRPAWLLALLPLLALLIWLWRRQLRSRSWQAVCDPELLPHLLLGRSRRRANWPLWLLLSGGLLALLALAGPTWHRQPQPLFRQQSALVVLLDLSRSMAAADLKPSRMERARLKIEDLLSQRREGQTALVAFAGDAFAVTPLTDDTNTIRALLQSLDPELMPVQGSDPQRAIELGGKLLRQAGLQRGRLLLITDEDRPERAMAAARQLRKQGFELGILGVGTPDGAPIPMAGGGFLKDNRGDLVLPKLHEQGLRQLAAAGGGAYRRLSIDDSDLQGLLTGLESHRLDKAEAVNGKMGQRWREEGVWLLWPLALLAALAFRRGWLILLVLVMLPLPAHALSWQDLWQRPDQQAAAAFAAGAYDQAAQKFQDPRWKASALYRNGQFQAADEALKESHTADDWYNRGNALARGGQLQQALQAYGQALKLQPDHADAWANKDLVEKALRQQQQPQQNHSQPPQSKNQQKSQQDQQSRPQQSPQGQQDGGKQPENAQGSGKDQSQPSPQAGGDHAGQSGDAGSTADNRSAESAEHAPQGDQRGTDPAGTSQAKTENSDKQNAEPDSGQTVRQKAGKQGSNSQTAVAEAEETTDPQQQASRQWLQGIPDDPGGLLRRKFLYQYRQRGQQLETDRPW